MYRSGVLRKLVMPDFLSAFGRGRERAIRDMRTLTGLPVISKGRRIGRAACVELTDDLTRIRGLFVDCGMRGSRFIPEQMIDLLGEVAIITGGSGRRTSARNPTLQRRALSTDGRLLGAVSGAMIDENTRSVEALLLSRGYIDDLLVGRQWVRQYTVNRDSGDVIFPGEGTKPQSKGGETL